VSGAADAPASPGWERLERAASAAAAALADWRRRAAEAEREVERLRAELESVSAGPVEEGASGEELRRLRAENALLTSRAAEARQRVTALLARLAVLERRR
jgi:predicted RNase H-like nuclease (RuvC/YqgF family)